jgi:hypothetical protein
MGINSPSLSRLKNATVSALKAASKALLQSTRELYLMKAEEYRSRINTTKEKINGDEPDYIQIAKSMIEKTNLTWDDISGLGKKVFIKTGCRHSNFKTRKTSKNGSS